MPFYNRPTRVTQTINGLLSWVASVGLTPADMVTVEVRGRVASVTRGSCSNRRDSTSEGAQAPKFDNVGTEPRRSRPPIS